MRPAGTSRMNGYARDAYATPRPTRGPRSTNTIRVSPPGGRRSRNDANTVPLKPPPTITMVRNTTRHSTTRRYPAPDCVNR